MSSKAVRSGPAFSKALETEGSRGFKARQTHENGRHLGRPRKEFQRRRGDNAERTLRADQQAFEVIARIVLAKCFQAVPDLPAGEDRLKAQHEIAGISIAQDVNAARVRCDVAADFTRALRARLSGNSRSTAAAAS